MSGLVLIRNPFERRCPSETVRRSETPGRIVKRQGLIRFSLRSIIKHWRLTLPAFAASITYVIFVWYHQFFATPVELYHRTWEACAQNIFDQQELKDWKGLEHRFDRFIKNNDDAVRYANKMLSTLGDPYTYLMSPHDLFSVQQRMMARDNIEFRQVANDIGVLTVHDFVKAGTAARIADLFAGKKNYRSIILDLRDNPCGSVSDCLQVASLFIPEGPLVTLEIRKGDGMIKESHVLRSDCEEIVSLDERTGKQKISKAARFSQVFGMAKVIVLVNERTASAAEMLAAALKENGRALVVGCRTFGKGIAQTGMPIANGAVLCITCVHYFTPAGHFLGTGRQLEGEGLDPDVVVKNSSTNEDAQLRQALAELRMN